MKKNCDCVCHKLGYVYCDCPTHAAFNDAPPPRNPPKVLRLGQTESELLMSERIPDYEIRSGGGDLFSANADPEAFKQLCEVARGEMAKGAYQMRPDELPYESSAKRVTRAILAALKGGVTCTCTDPLDACHLDQP